MAAMLAAADPLPAAATPLPGAAEPRPTPGAWYGSQTLLTDAAALGIGAVAFTHREDAGAGRFPSTALTLGLIASGVYVAGAPLVHLAHHRADAAGMSAGLRFVLPAAGGLLSLLLYGLAWGGCDACKYGAVVPLGLGLAAPIVVDAVDARSAPPAAPPLFRF